MARAVVRVASSSRAFTLSTSAKRSSRPRSFSGDLAQLLGEYLVVIHRLDDPAAVMRSSTRRRSRGLDGLAPSGASPSLAGPLHPLDLGVAPPVARVLDLHPAAFTRPVLAVAILGDDAFVTELADGGKERAPRPRTPRRLST